MDIVDTFEWFLLTVESGLKDGLPEDMPKRISYCKSEIDLFRNPGEMQCQLCKKPKYLHRESDGACPDYGVGGRFTPNTDFNLTPPSESQVKS